VRDGFARTSTDAIATAAGVSKRTLYHHYPTKEELLADILGDLSIQNFWRDTSIAVGPVQSRAALATILTEVALGITRHATDPTFLGLERTLIAEIPRFPHLARRFRAAVIEPGLAIVAAILQRAHASGVVAAPPSEAAVRLFVGPLLSYVYLDGLLTAAEDWRQPDPAELRALVDLFLNAVT
jgi:AcrR family transcriptional regulator